jgi:hypothetical protein
LPATRASTPRWPSPVVHPGSLKRTLLWSTPSLIQAPKHSSIQASKHPQPNHPLSALRTFFSLFSTIISFSRTRIRLPDHLALPVRARTLTYLASTHTHNSHTPCTSALQRPTPAAAAPCAALPPNILKSPKIRHPWHLSHARCLLLSA